VVAINKQSKVRSLVVVKADTPIQNFAELQGKTLALSKNTKAYTRLYLDRSCQQAGKSADGYFATITKEFVGRDRKTKDMNSEVALDQVVDGKAQATVVDSIALAEYERLKPARFKLLKVLDSSIEFPPTAVVCVDGAVDPAKLAKYQDALLNFHKSSKEAQSLLENWRLTQFTEVPADYEQRLGEANKAFPPPG
jgi:ABC-type phosphate/phosphonate transport system substrate-binding protein